MNDMSIGRALRYVFAVAVTIAALLIRSAIFSPDDSPAIVLFVLPVILSAFAGGLGPGLVSTMLAASGIIYGLARRSIDPSPQQNILLLELAVFLAIGYLFSVLLDRLRNAHAAAEETDQRHTAMLESVAEAVIATNAEGRVVSQNTEASRLTGWTQTQAAGQPLETVFRAVDASTHRGVDDALIYFRPSGATQAPVSPASLFSRYGDVSTIACRATEIRTPEGAPRGGVLAFREQLVRADTTDGRSSEPILAHELSAIAATAPGVLYSFQMWPDGRVCFPYASPTIRRTFGVEPHALASDGKVVFDRVHAEDVARIRASIADSAERLTEWHEEFRIVHPETGEMWAEGRSIPERQADGSVLWRGFLMDITARKATDRALGIVEADLRMSEARYRALADAAQDRIFVIGLDGRLEYVNRAAAAGMKIRTHDLVGKRVDDVFPPELVAAMKREIQDVQRTGKAVYAEHQMRFDDRDTWQSAWLEPILDDGLHVTRVMVIARDVTEQKALVALLERQRAVVDAIIQASPAGIGLLHGDAFVCDLANLALQQLAPGQPVTDVPFKEWWPGNAVPLIEMFERVRSTGVSEECSDAIVSASTDKAEARTLVVSASRVRPLPDAPPGVLVLATDVSARKSLERQFFQAQKMEALGRLAGGISHDFNNLLTSILGYTELVLATLDPGDPRRRDLEDIHRAGESAAALTHQLLAFSRQQVVTPSVINVNASLERLRHILTRTLGEDVKVSFELDHNVDRIMIDEGQLVQVLMNLCINGRDAMPAGGTLTIQTGNVHLDTGEQALRRWVPPGNYVVLKVSDSGSGMTPDVQSHLFEPFFTTKPVGQGTGLGLSTVYGIVQQNAGFIAVASESGRGTTFTIYLPQSDQPAPAASDQQSNHESPAALPAAGRHGTILIAEDNDAVRSLARRTLEECGYTTLAAKDAGEAVHLTDAFSGPIDLLLTDVVMPGGDGVALSRELVRRHPETRVLFMSGHTDNRILRHGAIGPDEFLQKPFTMAAMTRKVGEMLGEDAV